MFIGCINWLAVFYKLKLSSKVKNNTIHYIIVVNEETQCQCHCVVRVLILISSKFKVTRTFYNIGHSLKNEPVTHGFNFSQNATN